jgi:hypothetical protein
MLMLSAASTSVAPGISAKADVAPGKQALVTRRSGAPASIGRSRRLRALLASPSKSYTMVTRMLRRDSATNARLKASTVMRCAAVLAVVGGLAGCGSGSGPPGPYTAVNNYLTQIAEGNYSNACAMLDSATRMELVKRMGSKTSCAKLFVRCLPSQATNISRDQSQLLYATILVQTHRRKAGVTVAGTAVARAVRRVSLAKEGRTWKLTSPGEALETCRLKAHRLRAARRSPGKAA